MYPRELEIKDTTESNTSASYLDLLLSIGRDGQLRTSLYDKRNDFNFHITNFPFLSSNIPSNLTVYLVVWGFHRTFATGAACQQRTLTPPGTWSCATLGLACVLMSRPIFPELVLFPNFWVSNIPRYFCFAINLTSRKTVVQSKVKIFKMYKYTSILRSSSNNHPRQIGHNILWDKVSGDICIISQISCNSRNGWLCVPIWKQATSKGCRSSE